MWGLENGIKVSYSPPKECTHKTNMKKTKWYGQPKSMLNRMELITSMRGEDLIIFFFQFIINKDLLILTTFDAKT
jgi:outer membrane lipoprotein-sorting protein